MSALGPGSIGPVNLASSFAGAQQAKENRVRARAESSDPTFLVDLKAHADASLDDVAQSGESDDRDADGRLLHREAGQDHRHRSDDANHPERVHPLRAGDPFEERGNTLDLEA